jgi:hypothetical protein
VAFNCFLFDVRRRSVDQDDAICELVHFASNGNGIVRKPSATCDTKGDKERTRMELAPRSPHENDVQARDTDGIDEQRTADTCRTSSGTLVSMRISSFAC